MIYRDRQTDIYTQTDRWIKRQLNRQIYVLKVRQGKDIFRLITIVRKIEEKKQSYCDKLLYT